MHHNSFCPVLDHQPFYASSKVPGEPIRTPTINTEPMTEERSQDKSSESSNVEKQGGLATKVVATASTLMGPRLKGLPAVFRNQMFQKAINNALGDEQRNEKLLKKHGGEIRVELLTKQLRQERKLRGKAWKRKDFDVLSDEMLQAIPGEEVGEDRSVENEKGDVSNSDKSNNTSSSRSSSNNDNDNDNDRESAFSLFQGFTATIPGVDDELEQIKQGSSRLLEFDAGSGSLMTNGPLKLGSMLPPNVTEDKIRHSGSRKQLNGFKEDINFRLDLLEIRKGLSANEIDEIDSKIDCLYKQRKLVFDRISSFERGQSYLEDQLSAIEARLQAVPVERTESGSASDDNADNSGSGIRLSNATSKLSNNTSKLGNATSNLSNNTSKLSNATQSSYRATANGNVAGISRVSLSSNSSDKSPPGFFDAEEIAPSQIRKHKPTLQKYFKPGERISSFKAHDDSVTCLVFDEPFGKLVTASRDSTVKVWNLSSEKCIGQLKGHLASVHSLALDGGVVATGSIDATVKLWDLTQAGKPCLMKSLDGHMDEVTALGMSSGVLVSGSADKTIRQWDVRTGRCVATIDVVWAVNSRRDDSRILDTSFSFSRPGNLARMPAMATGWDQSQYPFTAALQCFDAALASGGSDGIVRLWDLRTGEVVRQLLGHTGPITSLQFDDTCLVTGSADSTVRIWDLRTGKIIDSFSYDSPITSLQFDYSKVVCTNGCNTVKIYDRITGQHRECGPGLENTASSIINFARYSQGYLVEGRRDGTVGIWAI